MKDLNTIINEIVQKAKDDLPYYLWEPQTALSRLLVAVPAKAIENLYIVSEYIKNLMSYEGLKTILTNDEFKENLKSALNLTDDDYWSLVKSDLDNIGYNYGIKRKGASYSRGVVELTFSAPDSVFIQEGTIFTSISGYKFSAVKDYNITPVEVGNGLYKGSIVVQSQTVGANVNIPAGFIRNCDSYIPNLVSIRNPYSFYNGRDEENNLDYLERIYNVVYYNSLGSKQWLLNFVLAKDYIIDASILTPFDPNFKRRYGADIWVVDTEEDIQTFEIDDDSVIVDYPPVVSYNASLVESSPENNVYARSIYDRVSLSRINSKGKITYSTDLCIYNLQGEILNPDYYFFGPERQVIVRKALSAEIFIHVDVYPVYGADSEQIKNDIKSDLQLFFSGGQLSYGKYVRRKEIGKALDVSDILQVIIDNPSVDRVNLDTFDVKIKRKDINSNSSNYTYYDDVEGQLLLKFYEYPILASDTVVEVL